MTIMLAGVAIGVRNEAAPATATSMRTGASATPDASAMATAMGATISTVAVLLTTWPSTSVRTNSVASTTRGPPSPTMSTSQPATRSAAPDEAIATDSGMRPPTSTTTCHDTAR